MVKVFFSQGGGREVKVEVELDNFSHFYQFDHNGLTKYGHEYGPCWFLCEELYKCRSPVKTELNKLGLAMPSSGLDLA